MKKIIIILGFLLVTLLGYGQVPTPNSANNNTYCLNDVQVYGDQVIDPLATYTFGIAPAVPFTIISLNVFVPLIVSVPAKCTTKLSCAISISAKVLPIALKLVLSQTSKSKLTNPVVSSLVKIG